MTETHKRMRRGFTLVEVLLYISLAAILFLAAGALLTVLLEARVKNRVIADVEQQGLLTMMLMTQTAQNAYTITSPATSTSASSLTLVVTAPNSPTLFSLSSGTLQIQEGGGVPVSLTNNRVAASSLSFANLSRTGTLGTVRITFTLSASSTIGTAPYTYSKVFTGSATLDQ